MGGGHVKKMAFEGGGASQKNKRQKGDHVKYKTLKWHNVNMSTNIEGRKQIITNFRNHLLPKSICTY